MLPNLLLISDVAERLKCNARTVRRLSDSAKMPAPLKIGGMLRWKADDIDAWIKGGCGASPQEKRERYAKHVSQCISNGSATAEELRVIFKKCSDVKSLTGKIKDLVCKSGFQCVFVSDDGSELSVVSFGVCGEFEISEHSEFLESGLSFGERSTIISTSSDVFNCKLTASTSGDEKTFTLTVTGGNPTTVSGLGFIVDPSSSLGCGALEFEWEDQP